MEDQVPFKVFAYWNKNSKPEVRRFGIEKTVVTSFHYLNAKLQEVFPGLMRKTYTVNWTDEDGDDIIISSDEEMLTALSALHGNLVKLNIYIKSEDEKEDDCDIVITAVADNPTAGPCPTTHYGVVCDACNSQVMGYRYKCVSCDDYDLCSTCESAGHHPEHCMVRVPSPMMPRTLIKAAIKRSRQFFKTVASAAADDNTHKRHRRDKSSERKHHGDRHHGDRERHHGEHHHRRPRNSWFDTFATYMNEFANLAGDIGLDNEEPKGRPQAKTQQAQQEKPKTSTVNTEAPPTQPEQNTSNASTNPNISQCPFMPGMENIPQLIEMYFNGSLAPLIQQFAQQAQPQQSATPNTSSTNNSTNTPATSPPAATNEDVLMPEVAPKPQEADKDSVKLDVSTSSSEESVKDASGDKVEGWTVINKERDLLETTNPSAPAEAGPIGFNLPQEFQKHVSINEGQNIYPPLNTATAVLNPKEPERAPLQEPLKPQVAPTPNPLAPSQAQPKPAPYRQPQPNAGPYPQPQATAGAYQQPQATAGVYPQAQATAGAYPHPGTYPHPQAGPLHPKPNIAIALQQMLAMGFTNEGGWLTQLLENTNGNISAVMDLLTPVKPM